MQINDEEEEEEEKEISRTQDFCRLRICFGKRAVSYWFDAQHPSAERTYV
jgi:hypothetical protein